MAWPATFSAYLSDEPVEACPPSVAYRLRKFAKKNRAALATAAAIAFLLVAGIGVSTWLAVLAHRAAEAEQMAKLDAEKAAAAAMTANEQTQKRLAQIEKGMELFAGMLRGIDPRSEAKEGKPLYDQLRQRAEQAAEQLQAEAVGDPQTVAHLQTILGQTLLGLGSYEMAVAMLEKRAGNAGARDGVRTHR